MGSTALVPDAWEDDWEAQADREAAAPPAAQQPGHTTSLTKAERLARHAEANRELWESAESPEVFHYAHATSFGPPLLASGFKPGLKVLSRRLDPTPPARVDANDPARSEYDGNGDGDEDHRQALSPDGDLQRQRQDRDVRLRKYEEARARIFGPTAPADLDDPSIVATGSDVSLTAVATGPAAVDSPAGPIDGQKSQRAKPRGRAPIGARAADARPCDNQPDMVDRPALGPGSAARGLYDPGCMPARGVIIQRRTPDDPGATTADLQPIRLPRGPDSNSRGFLSAGRRGSQVKST